MRLVKPFKAIKVQVLCLHLIFSFSLCAQKQFEASLNLGKFDSWATPSPSPYIYYTKSNLAGQYVNYKILYTVKPYFQTGIGYNNATNCVNFGFFDRTRTHWSVTLIGKSYFQMPFHQLFIPLQFNILPKYIIEPYIGVAPNFSFRFRSNYGEEHVDVYAEGEDTIYWKFTAQGLNPKTFGYLGYAGVKIHLFKRFIFKLEGGYSNSQKPFSKASLDYVYNGVPYKGITFKMHTANTFYSLGISYKFKLFKNR